MKPARFCFCVGSFTAPVPLSSDTLGMPWEFMGVYNFFQKSSKISPRIGQFKTELGHKFM